MRGSLKPLAYAVDRLSTGLYAKLAAASSAAFEICDARDLDHKDYLKGKFDVVLCTENIEHIIDDFRLVKAMGECLKPGGRLLLTTPQMRRISQNSMDYGPFPDFDDGRHVRRGYNECMLREFCEYSGLKVEEISYISGPVSQLQAYLLWQIGRIDPHLAWILTLPLRPPIHRN